MKSKGQDHTLFVSFNNPYLAMNVGYFSHGHIGHGSFGQDISARDISATENVEGGRFGHNHKFICLCVCMGGLMFACARVYVHVCMHACMRDGVLLSV